MDEQSIACLRRSQNISQVKRPGSCNASYLSNYEFISFDIVCMYSKYIAYTRMIRNCVYAYVIFAQCEIAERVFSRLVQCVIYVLGRHIL